MTSVQELQNIFALTLTSPQQGQNLLEQAARMPNHATLALQLVASAEAPELQSVRQAAAAHFKNIIKYSWIPTSDDEGNDLSGGIRIAEEERTAIKEHLVQLMCTAPKQIQALLSESIALVAASDYPDQWGDLMPSLVRQFESADANALMGALKTADSVCRRFRYVGRNDALYRVLKHALDHTQAPLTVLMARLGDIIAQPAIQQDKNQLLPYMEALRLVCSIFYSLNYQDLPAYFEDNMGSWMVQFQKYFQTGIFAILEDPGEEDNPSALDVLQTAIVKILRLYSDKDEEDFVEKYLQGFVTLVLNRLLATTVHNKHDQLVTSSIRFIASLILRPAYAQMFNGFLPDIVEHIVLPNLKLREAEIENFSDNPFEFILTEIEGADSESRRSAVQALLRSMTRNLETETVQICQTHVQALLQRFAGSPGTEWPAKDVAIHLFLSLAIRTENMSGVSEVNPSVNIQEFFQLHILSELQDTSSQRPIVKAAAIKFVSTFRKQFSSDECVHLLPLVIAQLHSTEVVVHTFAAHTIERMMVTKDANVPKITAAQLQPQLNALFTGLFTVLDNQQLNENDYVMKCIMRGLVVARRDLVPVTKEVLSKLSSALKRVAANPRHPKFNHYLFESIAILVRSVCSLNPDAYNSFEEMLIPDFTKILEAPVPEFTPYVFQIFAQMIEGRPTELGLGTFFLNIFNLIKKPAVWVNKGEIPALTRLLQAYVEKAPAELAAAGQTEAILGIYQKLLSSNITHSKGVDLVNAIMINFDRPAVEPYFGAIITVLMQVAAKRPTPKINASTTSFLGVFSGKFGGPLLRTLLDQLDRSLLTHTVALWSQSLLDSTPIQRVGAKIQVIGVTRFLFEDPTIGHFVLTNSGDAFAKFVLGIAKILSSVNFAEHTRVEGLDDDDFVDVQYDSQFAELKYARPLTQVDPFPERTSVDREFVAGLAQLTQQVPGVLGPAVERVDPNNKFRQALQTLVQNHGIQIT